jgi:RNA polymerase sigma-70 factor (ECF subfamily)
MNARAADSGTSREAFDQLLAQLRPKLHRYCARMAGSVIDGEDLVQAALLKALEAFADATTIANPEGWVFRIAHNTVLDFLRRRSRREFNRSDEDPDTMVDPKSAVDDREIVATSLRTFMRLPAAQRSSVILMDVLGYSLQQIGDVTSLSIPGVKAALHRGRARLRELAQEPDDLAVPVLADRERSLLAAYVDRFNARDVDAVRMMLADEVRLDLVAKLRLHGRPEVSRYFSNYAKVEDWRLMPGLVDGHAAALVRDPGDPSGKPCYFVLLDWAADKLVSIRDFRFARYAIEGAEMVFL